MEQHLGLKISAEIAAIVKWLKSKLHTVESDTKTMIAVGHLDSAEKNLPIIDLLCTVLNHVDTIEGMPFSTLSNSLREKRYLSFVSCANVLLTVSQFELGASNSRKA
jgi:hypothetical protein